LDNEKCRNIRIPELDSFGERKLWDFCVWAVGMYGLEYGI
jgi:hypothetical protein